MTDWGRLDAASEEAKPMAVKFEYSTSSDARRVWRHAALIGLCWPPCVRIVQWSNSSSHTLATMVMIKIFETVAEGGVIRLPLDVSSTAHCVVTVLEDNLESLREQSRLELPEGRQRRMSELLLKNREGTLTSQERDELDALAEEFDAATLAKGRALAALAHLSKDSHRD